MTTWHDTRRNSRLAVHARFAVPATYTPPNGGVPVSCSVRLHTKIARFGDLDREGYAEVVEDVNRVVFLQSEVPEPARKGVVRITATGVEYTIDIVVPPDDDTIIACEVKPPKVGSR